MKIINLYGILVRSIKEIYAVTQTFLFFTNDTINN